MPGKYVEFGGHRGYRPPFTAKDVHFYGFLVEVKYDQVKQLFDKHLNDPSGGAVKFLPIGFPGKCYVTLSFAALPRQHANDPGLGEVPELDFIIWVPGIDVKRMRLGWFIPYIFVDSGAAMSTGREVYGFPKQFGWFDMPSPEDEPELFTVETLVIKEYRNGAQATREPLVTIKRTSKNSPLDMCDTFEETFLSLVNRLFGRINIDPNEDNEKREAEEEEESRGGLLGSMISINPGNDRRVGEEIAGTKSFCRVFWRL